MAKYRSRWEPMQIRGRKRESQFFQCRCSKRDQPIIPYSFQKTLSKVSCDSSLQKKKKRKGVKDLYTNPGVWDEDGIRKPQMSFQFLQYRALTSPCSAGSRTPDCSPYPSPKDHHLIPAQQEQTALHFSARTLRPLSSRKCLPIYQRN